MPEIRVNGTVRDLFGYPYASASIQIVTGYQMADDWLWEPEVREVTGSFDRIPITVVATYVADSNGRFAFSINRTESRVGLRVRLSQVHDLEGSRVNAPAVTKTTIPFDIVELRKSGTDYYEMQPLPESFESIDLYVDPSRDALWLFWWRRRGRMSFALEHSDCRGYQGDHRDPDAFGSHLESDNHCHWGFPKIDDERLINLPWGSEEAVVPFVVAEGRAVRALVGTSGDYDRLFRLEAEANYGHLSNALNHKPDWARGLTHPIEGEMCSWFMGRKLSSRRFGLSDTFGPSDTNVKRDESSDRLDGRFAGRRVWMVGTWCREKLPIDYPGGVLHHPWNEIHPAYWIVPFVGGWRRFCAAEMVALGRESSGRSFVEATLDHSPTGLLGTVKSAYIDALNAHATESWSRATDFYSKSIVRLNQYGAQMSTGPDPTSNANSLDYSVHLNWSAERSTLDLGTQLLRRIDVTYGLLTTLGSGVLVFPCMLFTFEALRVIRFCRDRTIDVPVMNLTRHQVAQAALLRFALSRASALMAGEWRALQDCYRALFERLRADPTIPAADIAQLYASAATHLVSYGAFDETDPLRHPNFQTHHDFALARAKNAPAELSGNLNDMFDELIGDLLPHSRED